MMLLQVFYYFVQSFQRAILENGLQLILLYDCDFK